MKCERILSVGPWPSSFFQALLHLAHLPLTKAFFPRGLLGMILWAAFDHGGRRWDGDCARSWKPGQPKWLQY
eukprot:7600874-Pyramimonas_sp.AAC.1